MAAKTKDGDTLSEWDPPGVSPKTYAACVYCTAPVDVTHIVDRAVADAVISIGFALHEFPPEKVLQELESAVGWLEENIRMSADQSIVVRAMRSPLMSRDPNRKHLHEASGE